MSDGMFDLDGYDPMLDKEESDEDIIERGNRANEFLNSHFWIDYLEPKLNALEKNIIKQMKEHSVEGSSTDAFEFVRFQQGLKDVEMFKDMIMRDVRDAKSVISARKSEADESVSRVGIPMERNGR